MSINAAKPVAGLGILSQTLNCSAFFVTATDTDVGKTVVSRALIRALRANGDRVCAVKPVAAGCRKTRTGWSGGDAPLLREATGGDCDDLLLRHGIRPGEAMVSLKAPMSPLSAARREKRRFSVKTLRRTLHELATDCEHEGVRLLIEGVGGPLVPLGGGVSVADLTASLDIPCVLATRTELGTVSQTLMAFECLRSRGVRVSAIVASRTRAGRMTDVEQAGIHEIRQNTPSGVPLVVLRRLRNP